MVHADVNSVLMNFMPQKSSMNYIGIDPGLRGGIALIQDNKKIVVIPMPLIGPKDYDVQIMSSIFLVMKESGIPILATIEKQQAMPGQGLSSTLKTGIGFGLLIGLLTALEIPFQVIPPQKWQKNLFVGLPVKQDTKDKSAIIAKRLFPGVDFKRTDRCTTLSDGLTDAACIAEYGRRTGKTGGIIEDVDKCDHISLQENPNVCIKCGNILNL